MFGGNSHVKIVAFIAGREARSRPMNVPVSRRRSCRTPIPETFGTRSVASEVESLIGQLPIARECLPGRAWGMGGCASEGSHLHGLRTTGGSSTEGRTETGPQGQSDPSPGLRHHHHLRGR